MRIIFCNDDDECILIGHGAGQILELSGSNNKINLEYLKSFVFSQWFFFP